MQVLSMQQVYFLFALLSNGYLIDDYCVIHLAYFICRVKYVIFNWKFLTFCISEVVFGSLVVSDGYDEDYEDRNGGGPIQLKNTHPDAAAAWLLLILRGIDGGLCLTKDSAKMFLNKYLEHYVKVLSHVQL